ncbi:hypothetical protein [Streptomyces sp. NPDC089919]|uniref:DUF7848 domain-containing protein n=1 Tax=Streptomyces sp. NPDC089919 TaxID=3155188 RepID=UPI003441CF7D
MSGRNPRAIAPAAIDTPADWLLTPDHRGTTPITEIECTTCLDGPGPLCDEPTATAWCLAHARHASHDTFRRITTDFHRAVLTPHTPGG